MVEYRKPNFPADAFSGTAEYYARFRPPYPDELIEHLLMYMGETREETLLDLACGPGRVALSLGPAFRKVVAVDLEPEMIEQGKTEASRRENMPNMSWLVGNAEDVSLPAQSIGAITIGDAFHRLDQKRVLSNAMQWLKPAGSLAILGSRHFLSQEVSWQRVVAEIIRNWTGLSINDYSSSQRIVEDIEQCENVLRHAGFGGVVSASFSVPHTWTIESIIGYLNSTSYGSRAALGTNADAFGADLKSALTACGSGPFGEELSFGYTAGRKPSS